MSVIRDTAANARLVLLLYKATGCAGTVRSVDYCRVRGSASRTESFLRGTGKVFERLPPNRALLRDQRTRRNETMLCRIRYVKSCLCNIGIPDSAHASCRGTTRKVGERRAVASLTRLSLLVIPPLRESSRDS